MKHRTAILIAVLMLLPAAAQATPLTKTMANAYYQRCTAQRDQRMSAEGQQAMCACTSAQMLQSMTTEDIQAMTREDAAARDARQRMLVNVYVPCMNYPAQDFVEYACQQDDKITKLNLKTDRKQLCHCMAEKTSNWFASNGRALIMQLLKANPNLTDPISPVLQSAQFKKSYYEGLTACVDSQK